MSRWPIAVSRHRAVGSLGEAGPETSEKPGERATNPRCTVGRTPPALGIGLTPEVYGRRPRPNHALTRGGQDPRRPLAVGISEDSEETRRDHSDQASTASGPRVTPYWFDA